MRKQVGYLDKMGDEQFFYLDFDESTGQFTYVVEYIGRNGERSEHSEPLQEAQNMRGYHRAIQAIRENLFDEKA